MTSRDFCYWLQGFMEMATPISLSTEQTKMIKDHLAMVFIHEIDPSFPEEQQEKLNQLHEADSETYRC